MQYAESSVSIRIWSQPWGLAQRPNLPAFSGRFISAAAAWVVLGFSSAVAQQAKASGPRALFEIAKPPYLLVYDCTRGSTCRRLGPKDSVAVVDGFMFFSLLTKGVDTEVPHKVILKLDGAEVPGA